MRDTFEPAKEHILDRLQAIGQNDDIKLMLDDTKIWQFSTFKLM